MTVGTRLVGGRYELTAPLATGGMGRVWRGRDTVLHRPVAVKILRPEFSNDPTFRARFRAEARHAGVLSHPNIAPVFDYGEVESDGETLAYLVMELVDGEPLSALLAREGRLTPDRTLEIVRQTAAALAAAHAAGVVHRDVKPGNVLLGPHDTVKITDFGIAVSRTSVPLTETGQVIGTAHYLSPEQASGQKATAASDVYALGAVAYECLTGRRPFEGENSVQIALKQIREQPEPLPANVPASLRALVDRALAKDPAERFPDGGALLAAIEQLNGTRPLAAPGPTGTAVMSVLPAAAPPAAAPPAAPPPRQGSPRRVPWPLLAGGLVALALVAVLIALTRGNGTPTTQSANGSPSTAPARSATVAVALDRLVGRPVDQVQAELVARGLHVQLAPVTTTAVPTGQVTAVSPVGSLPPGSTVTVSYAITPAITQAPPGQGNGDKGGNGKGGRGQGGND